jgi:hypothetical protein
MKLFLFIFSALSEGTAGTTGTETPLKKTLGQYRVGVEFNPGRNPLVDEIKKHASDAIDYINLGTISPNTAIDLLGKAVSSVDDKGDPEIIRLKDLTFHQMEACGRILRQSGYSNVSEMSANKENAMTCIEDAAMWGVKAATKSPMD